MSSLAFLQLPLIIRSKRRPSRLSSPIPHACSRNVSQSPPLTPPTSIEQTLSLAAISLDRALSSGIKRAKITALIPGLNPLIEETVPYSDSLLNTFSYSLTRHSDTLSSCSSVALLFKSAGTAAAARFQYPDNDDACVRFESYFRRDARTDAPASPHANVIVNPTSARGDNIMDDLETVVERAPDALWVVLNADMGVDRAAVGMRESARRDRFLNSFVDVFYIRNLFEIRRPQLIPIERGALLHVYDAPWTVFALDEKGYAVAEQFDIQPDSESITRCVRRSILSAKPTKRKAQSGVDKEFMRVLAFCAGGFTFVYFALYAASHI